MERVVIFIKGILWDLFGYYLEKKYGTAMQIQLC